MNQLKTHPKNAKRPMIHESLKIVSSVLVCIIACDVSFNENQVVPELLMVVSLRSRTVLFHKTRNEKTASPLQCFPFRF